MKIRLSPLFENWDFPFVTHQKKRSATFCGEQRSDRTCGIRPDRETSNDCTQQLQVRENVMRLEKALGAVKVIKDQIQYRSQSLLNLARGYFKGE